MRLVLTLVPVALRRLRANAELAVCALAALVVAVALAVSVPSYADGASLRVLREELERQERQQARSAFALLFRYVATPGQGRTLDWADFTSADRLLSDEASYTFGLPVAGRARHARSTPLRVLLPPAFGNQASQVPSAANLTIGFVEGLGGQMRISDGAAPRDASTDGPVEVLAARALADTLGLNVGDELTALVGAGVLAESVPLQIAGFWEPVDAADPSWFYHPDALRDVLLVPETSLADPRVALLSVDQALWFVRLDGTRLDGAAARPLLNQVERVEAQVAGLLLGLQLEQSPADALRRYTRTADALALQLAAVAAPTLGLTLYFTALVAGLLVRRQRDEIALLSSRGVLGVQIIGIAAVEWLLLSAAALLIGPALGLAFAQLMARTGSFLRLHSDLPPLTLALTPTGLGFGLATVCVAVLAALVPAAAATRRTLAGAQREASRVADSPAWRPVAGLILLAASFYGLWQLRTDGGLLGGVDPLADPLPLAVPTLLCIGFGLLVVGILPVLFAGLARLAELPSWSAPLIALRALARQPDSYRGTLLLLVLTQGLGIVSGTLAAGADDALEAATAYQAGATTQLRETGESTQQGDQGVDGSAPSVEDIREEARFRFVPVSEHLTVPGIRAVARVGRYSITLDAGGRPLNAQLIGVDRLELPRVIERFDPGWAGGESLGGLMNLLAANPDGALVSREALSGGLRVGDTFPALVELFGDRRELRFRVVGAIDLWPGVYPQEGPIVVTNIDYLFDQMGGQYPYDVWVARDPAVPVDSVAAGVRRLGINLVDTVDAAELAQLERASPQRQGLFGVLSVGFVAAGLLSVLGMIIGGLITGRQRTIELGVLRALGLSSEGALATLLIEQSALALVGISVGTALGLLSALLSVPHMQIGAGPWPGTPPIPPRLPWVEILLLAGLATVAVIVAVLVLAVTLVRTHAIQAVKLGETG